MSKKALVITGASRGIGRATAELFRDNGYQVINISRRDPELADVTHIAADLSQTDWTQNIAAALGQAVANVDTLSVIHSAGLLLKDNIDSVTADDLHRVMQVNVIAAAQLNQLLLPSMGAGSSIVYVGSTLSEKAVANSCSYVTSKHAMVGLMRANAQDLAGRGIHAVCVCPGFTETEMLSDHVGGSREILDDIASGVTFNRLIEPSEMASTLKFAAENPVMNGSVMHANLGQIER
ncbi:MAG: SDR family NAD(P)-dependent oxidoreductase [Pseudomonadales bacterium]|nr:SDR family NAD(P)-dependent oxidoreductase [Pseudomonadales bacterium]